MEIIIESINITENTQIVKSVNWSYGIVSGSKELEEPNKENFIEFEILDNDIIKSWLNNLIDFSMYDIIENKEEKSEKIITVILNK